MQTKTYERVVINAGSVIVLQNVSQSQIKNLEVGVGVYLSEGFGEVLLNPVFLEKEEKFSLNSYEDKASEKEVKIDDDIVQFLVKEKI